MVYNIYIRTSTRTYNIFGITEGQLSKLINGYLNGDASVTLSGKRHELTGLQEFKIFSYDMTDSISKVKDFYLNNIHFRKQRKGQPGYFLPVTALSKMGEDITKKRIEDSEYGLNSKKQVLLPREFVSSSRISELAECKASEFDLSRLIRLCEEINSSYSNGNYMAVGMIARTIINHIPPIFKYSSFEEVAANYGGQREHRSFKKNMKHLNESLKNIADNLLHQTIRKKETVPTEIQIDFKQDLDVLLGEIARILKL